MPGKSFLWLGAIREPMFFFFFDIDGGIGTKNAKEVRSYLQEDADNTANIIISSNGGDEFLAERMIGLLAQYKSRITVEVVGLAASAGASLAVGLGSKTYVRESSSMMIHAPSSGTFGNKLDHENSLRLFENGHKTLRGIFKDTKLTKKELDSVFDQYQDLWFTADEAVKKGLAVEVLEANEEVNKILQDMEDDEEGEEDAIRERLVANFPIDKIADVLGTQLAAEYVSNQTSTTEEDVDEKAKKALEAKIEALEDKVKSLEASNKSLKAQLNAKDLAAKTQKYEAAVDGAIAKKAIAKDDRDKWLKRCSDGGDSIVETLNEMEPHPFIDNEMGSGNDRKDTKIADVPSEVVSAYREADPKITDEQIVANWDLDR